MTTMAVSSAGFGKEDSGVGSCGGITQFVEGKRRSVSGTREDVRKKWKDLTVSTRTAG